MDYSIETNFPQWVNEVYRKLEPISSGVARAAEVVDKTGLARTICLSHLEWLNNNETNRRILIEFRGNPEYPLSTVAGIG